MNIHLPAILVFTQGYRVSIHIHMMILDHKGKYHDTTMEKKAPALLRTILCPEG